MSIISQIALPIGLVCSIVLSVNEHGGNFILNSLSLLLYLAFQRANGTLSASHENIIKQIPATIGGALARFTPNYKTIPFAVCACHATYALSYSPGSDVPTYPEFCTHHPSPEAECGEPLLDVHRNGERLPKKTFTYHNFNSYLANLLSRLDVEALMDQSCDELVASLSEPPLTSLKIPSMPNSFVISTALFPRSSS